MEGDQILLESWPIKLYAIQATEGWSWRGYGAIELRSGDRSKSNDITWETAPSRVALEVGETVYPIASRLYLHKGDEASPLTYTTADQDDSSAVSMQQAVWWFQNCSSSHGHPHVKLPRLPTRVIDVDPTLSQPRLKSQQSGEPLRGQYAALSYCWGTTKATITTVANIQQHLEVGLDFHSLPKTIQDAVTVTRALGLQYLWVDALCILQGADAEARRDWDVESSRMATVYGDAAITIVAASANDCGGGIFRKRSLIRTAKVALDGFTNRRILSAQRQMTTDLGFSSQYNVRGWTLQEMVLSPRALFFTPSFKYWKCPHGVVGEDCKQSKFGAVKSLTREHAQRDWHAIVQEYSRRTLTNGNDKFPALSGLANIYHQLNPSPYYAGIWQSSILRDLLWRTELSETMTAGPVSWRAPSWSWASTNDPVDYDLAHGNIDDASYQAEIVTDVQVDSVDPFGRLKQAKLNIRSMVKPVHQWTTRAYHTAGDATTDGLTVRAYVDTKKKWDVEEEILEPCQMLLLTRTRGLIITNVNQEQDVYRRIGVFMVTPRYRSHDLDIWQKKSLILI